MDRQKVEEAVTVRLKQYGHRVRVFPTDDLVVELTELVLKAYERGRTDGVEWVKEKFIEP